MMRVFDRKWVILTAAVLAVAGMAAPVGASYNTDLFASSNVGSSISFNGAGNFTFTNGHNGVAGITITGADPGPTLSVGDTGTLGGSYKIGPITTVSGGGVTVQSATVTANTTANGPPYHLTFTDHLGNSFTGTIAFVNISTTEVGHGSQGGLISGSGTINLTNVTYSGSEPDLQAFLKGGTASVSFTFTPGRDNLSYLASHSASTSFSLDLSSVPEPSTLALALLASPLGLGYWIRRRKAAAVTA